MTDSEYARLLGYDQILTDQVKKELALADAVYTDNTYLDGQLSPTQAGKPAGFDIIKVGKSDNTGFYGAAYLDSTDGHIYIAFRGSDNAPDWVNNAAQALGAMRGQYPQALTFTNEVLALYPDSNVSFVGHSLGGGLSMYAAGMTGLNATTFNAAKLDVDNYNAIKNSTQYSAIQKVQNFVFDNEIVQNFADHYYGNTRLINLGTEGRVDDHLLAHVRKDFDVIKQNANQRLQRDFTVGNPITGAGSIDEGAITVVRNTGQSETYGISVIFTNPNDGISNFIKTNQVLMTNTPLSTLIEYYLKRELGGDALQDYRDRQAIVDAEYSINAADVFPDSFFKQNVYQIAQGLQASSHWLLSGTDTVQTATSAIDPTTYGVATVKALTVAAVVGNFKDLSPSELDELTEIIEASVDGASALRVLSGHADEAYEAQIKLSKLKSKASFKKYSAILNSAKSEILLAGLDGYGDLVKNIMDEAFPTN